MNNERTIWSVGIAFLIACFLFAVIVASVKYSTPVPAIDADRAAVRARALVEIRATEAQALNDMAARDLNRPLGGLIAVRTEGLSRARQGADHVI